MELVPGGDGELGLASDLATRSQVEDWRGCWGGRTLRSAILAVAVSVLASVPGWVG